jgi:purine-nucleoside phosphorylase
MSSGLTPESVREAATRIRERIGPGRLRGLLVAGSGLEIEIPGWDPADELPFVEVFPFAVGELAGHRQSATVWQRGDELLMVFNGRLHLYQGYSTAEIVMPVRVAGLLGAEIMIATNAVGSLDQQIETGSLVVITDHLNLQGANPLVGAWGLEFGAQFPDMSDAYDLELRALAVEAGREAGFAVSEGVYAAVLGPSFETPAEVRMLQGLGATVVGMSTVPEVVAARHMGIRTAVLSFAANPAAGLVDRPLTADEVYAEAAKAAPKLTRLIELLVERVFS